MKIDLYHACQDIGGFMDLFPGLKKVFHFSSDYELVALLKAMYKDTKGIQIPMLEEDQQKKNDIFRRNARVR